AACRARVGEAVPEVVGVLGRGDEVPAGVLDTGRSDPPDDRVLDGALVSGGGIRDDIPAARVKEPVVAAARAGSQVGLLDEQRLEATPGEVAEQPGARRAPADDEGVDGRRTVHLARPVRWGEAAV